MTHKIRSILTKSGREYILSDMHGSNCDEITKHTIDNDVVVYDVYIYDQISPNECKGIMKRIYDVAEVTYNITI